jgi:predicted transcriptional regulator
MPTLVELTTQIVTAQTSVSALSTDEIVSALTRIHATLGQLEGAASSVIVKQPAQAKVTIGKAAEHGRLACMICGKSFKVLGAHLQNMHGINTKEYRKRFSLPVGRPVAVQGAIAVLPEPIAPAKPQRPIKAQRSAKPVQSSKPAAAPLAAPRQTGRPRKNA